MITRSDSYSTIDLGKYYAIMPPDYKLLEKYKLMNITFEKVNEGFSYNSSENFKFLNVEEIRELIINNIDSNFNPIIPHTN